MNKPPSNNDPDLAKDSLQEIASETQARAGEVLKSSQATVRENPLLFALGAFTVGMIIGSLCNVREPRRKDTSEVARDLVDDIVSRISDRLSNFKKQSCCSSSLLGQCQHVGKKLKWW